jgi:hypothetical protein
LAIIDQVIVRAYDLARNAQLSATCEELGGNRSALVFSTVDEEFPQRIENEMKTKSRISGYVIRSAAYAVFLAVAFIAASSAFNSPNKWYKSAVATVGYNRMAKSPNQPRALSFAERVAYQRAIEDVYWRHRMWPKENSDPKPSLDAVMTQAQLESKVTDYLQKSQALEDYWQQPITADQLQAEMDRMAQHTRQPQMLREVFAALGNDPFIIAECLARPLLAERLLTQSAREQVKQTSGSYEQVAAATGAYRLPSISDDGACSDDTWTATTTANAPLGRAGHTAVWTGSEMIVWGGYGGRTNGELNAGGRYNPSTDTWTPTSTANAPTGRGYHTAVWTGSEMIVWGGFDGHRYLTIGGRYNPSTDSWRATSGINAPDGRADDTAVWTGGEMIVWGGLDDENTGGRYNPTTNSWTATSTANAPSARRYHTAVWTGGEMIVWGGYVRHVGDVKNGGRYNPITDHWTGTSTINAPSGREVYTAVWTGSEMIVWGGNPGFKDTGGRYCAAVSQLGNISTRAFVQTGDNAVIGGFMVQGSQPKRVIIRAIGPELAQYGVPNVLANPTLELHNGTGALIASNDNWRTTIISGIIMGDQSDDIRNSGYAPGDGREPAMIAELPAGNYSAIVRGVNNMTGVALIEVYDLSTNSNSILGNISTRASVQTGDDVLIGGFIVRGGVSKKVIVRAIGPELTQYGVPNALADPILELHDGTGALIASNDNWVRTIIGGIITANQFRAILDSGYAPTDLNESVIIADLPAGHYTTIVRGVNNMTGVGLVEIYDPY